MRKFLIAVSLATVALTGCNFELPQACANLTVTQQDRDAAANGYDVEKTDSLGNECELSQDGQSWSVDS